ncbi:MAG: O-antigen ligase family protein [Gemmatimonadales bacterium]
MTGSSVKGTPAAGLETGEAEVRVIPPVRWALYLLAFSIPLEYPDRFAYEVTTMTGVLVLLCAMLQPRVCFGRLPWALACYGCFLYAQLVSLVTEGTIYPGGLYLKEVSKLFQLISLWVLVFWVCSNLFRQERIRRGTLWSLILGCVIRAALPILGWGRTAHLEGSGGERVAILGQNPNQSAQVLALGLLALIGLVYVQPRGTFRPRILAWAGVGLVTLSLVETGSRGGLVTLALGLLVFLTSGQTLRMRIRNASVAVVALGVLYSVAVRSELVVTRIAKAQEGDLAKREDIFPTLVGMIREKPLLGWGPITNKYELAVRLGDPEFGRRDTHNIVLEVVTASGLLGLIPFLVGIWLCLKAAWAARAGPQGVVPLALLLAVLIGNMTQNRLATPLLWMVLAYALAGSAAAPVPAVAAPGARPWSGFRRLLVWPTRATP